MGEKKITTIIYEITEIKIYIFKVVFGNIELQVNYKLIHKL